MSKLRLKNNWDYKGNNRWDWEVFLYDNGSGQINNVNFVEYVLHPSFPNPRRIENNRKENFRLKTNGWGIFLIKAFVYLKSGEKILLKHHLKLELDPRKGETK